MIEPCKLVQLSGGQKRRKLALCFGSLERDILGIAEKGCQYNIPNIKRADYIKALVKIVLKDPKIRQGAKQKLESLLKQEPIDERLVCNYARNELLAIIGTFPAEWDLVIAPHKKDAALQKRNFFSGVYVYADDIRAPFNLGSIFRTAEALGADTLFLSPLCADEKHPRATRSSMGCIQTLPYKRIDFIDLLKTLPKDFPIFALETGGTPIQNFAFPKQGLVVIGSEELGVSPDILKLCHYGTVSIKMVGLKASLNVGVAFGILLQEWTKHCQ